MHIHRIENQQGNIVDINEFCSDSCNREHSGESYSGWDGCHETEFNTKCKNCDTTIKGFAGESWALCDS